MDETPYYITLDGRPYILCKDRCTTAHGPNDDRLAKSSTRTRQTEQQLMSMAYESSSLMLAIDRRIFDTLEERLQGRTSDIAAWTKTVQPIIRISISEAQDQLRTGHRDIRTFFSDTAATERNTNETLATANTMTDNLFGDTTNRSSRMENTRQAGRLYPAEQVHG
jgi:hypothetical protein